MQQACVKRYTDMNKKMSINVTIDGNAVCVRPSQMFLSDTEQIKKNERERRRRLRLEQVRQQSKKLSSEVLKRAKNAAKKELNKWEKDCKSELRKMHDLKIMEIQKKLQEDMDDIGLAHNSAALQPDVDAIMEEDRQNNRICAAERGKEARQRLKEYSQKADPAALHQERLRQVREIENIRSSMVAQLPIKTCTAKDSEKDTNSSEETGIVVEKSIAGSAKKKKHKKLVGKKSPGKVVSKSNVKVVGQHQKGKSTKRMVVEDHRENSKSPKRATTSKNRKSSSGTTENSEEVKKIETEIECTNPSCNRDSEDQEPRKTVPTIKLTPTKADKVARYNPNDYKQKTSDSNSSSSSSVSDDSSYFSDGCGELLMPKTTSKSQKSISSSKVQLYDHCTRHRNSYDHPIGLVEKLDIRNEPNAKEAARELIEAENLASSLLESRRIAAQKRDEDSMLRERVRRDWNEMLKNSENKARTERIEKATFCTNRHVSESRRNHYETERHRSEEPVVQIILHDTEQPGPSRLTDFEERARRISPRDDRERTRVCTGSCRQEEPIYECPTCCVRHESAEKILKTWSNIEWIKKIEQQKRLLLREFGADLPSTIFNASTTPLFENRSTSSSQHQPATSTAKQPSPEIKSINMSSSDDNAKKTSAGKKKSKKTKTPVLKTTETAVQTSRMDEIGAAKDKSVQVEILSEELRESRRKSESPRNGTSTSENLEYVEPRVVVLTPPEVCNSSSGSSISRDIIIELDNHQVKVTPKKRKSCLEKSAKRRSPVRSKPRSLPTSHPGSPVKKHPTSAPSSRSGSPKKHDSGRSARSRTPEKVVDIVVNKGTVKVQTGVIPESSHESTMPDSTPEIQQNGTTAGRTYRIFKHPTVKKVSETSRDTSDTSTSYASLPAKTAPRFPLSRHQITPILEMLDSSANESIRAGRMNVSPVSTPGTPSPRIINVPSNMPHPERIGRFLKFDNSTIEGTPGPDSTLFSSTQRENSSSTDPSYSQTRNERPVTDLRTIGTRRSGKSSDYCSCANPTCQLLHDNINDIRDYATKNHPEVLEKYEDLQNICAERIASLTEDIQRVRNEQRGMEFSMISPADETSLMQLPPPKPYRSDFQSVQRLIESVEAIHCKLARTLRESQKIITGGTMPNSETSPNPEGPACSTSYETKSKGSTSTSTEETPVPLYSAKTKPRVVSNEAVNIDIDRLKRGRGPYTTMLVTTDNNSWPSPGTPRRHEEIVAKLYQEILEQSKTVDNSRERSSNGGEESLSGRRTPSPPQNLAAPRKQNSPKKVTEDEVTKDERHSPRPKKDEEFVPLLAGIPKIPRALPTIQTGTRPRPPPAGKPYRSELSSPVHELSTIVEFDTPDTVNRSQGSTKSPSGKSRRILQLQSPAKSISSPRLEKNAKTQTGSGTASSKGGPVITENMSRTIPRKLAMRDVASPDDKFVKNSDNDRALSERGTTKSLLSQGPNTSIECEGSRTNGDGKSVECLTSGREKIKEKHDREETPKAESCDTVDDKLAALLSNKLNIDSGLGRENKNEKLTSTSSNSFSGLSGISEIVSSPTSDLVKWASSSEEIETALKKMGLGWAVVTLKKTREASALSSSSNSDLTPMNIARRTKSPSKKALNDENLCGLPDFISDVSSISIKEASKSTERAVLMKARTSTPNIQISNSTSEKSVSATTSSSGISVQDHSDSLTAPNLSLTNNKR